MLTSPRKLGTIQVRRSPVLTKRTAPQLPGDQRSIVDLLIFGIIFVIFVNRFLCLSRTDFRLFLLPARGSLPR
jgi:hypothetical protein